MGAKVLRRIVSSSAALSLLYDALLFIVLISLCGVALIPAIQNPSLQTKQIESFKEDQTVHVLDSLLCSKVPCNSYCIGGNFIDSLNENFSINTSEGSLFHELSSRMFERQSRHLCFSELIAAVLGSQWRLPFENGVRMNIFTTDFESSVVENITLFLSESVSSRYNFYFSASWRPLLGLDFGGWFNCGLYPPQGVDVFVAKKSIKMPFDPLLISFGNSSQVLNQHTIECFLYDHQNDIFCIDGIFNAIDLFGNDSVLAKRYFIENASTFFQALLFEGIYDDSGNLIVEGLFSSLFSLIFSHLETLFDSYAEEISDELIDDAIGISLGRLDGIIEGLTFDGFQSSPIGDYLVNQLKNSFDGLLDIEEVNFSGGFEEIKQNLLSNVSSIAKPAILSSVGSIVNGFQTNEIYNISCFIDSFLVFVFDLLSFSEAEVVLMLWSWEDFYEE